MSIIFHASDLHFGRSNPDVADALLNEIRQIGPDVAVLSGDFTQIGSNEEFLQAHDFIKSLPCPYLAVPGNHDIPARHFMKRFFSPYDRYRRYINDQIEPIYQDENFYIVGLNTARPMLPHWNWANGKISHRQLEDVKQRFSHARPDQWKILVCHHPLYALVDSPIDTMVWRSGRLRDLLRALGVHMVMTGHIHHASVTFDKVGDAGLYHVGAASAFSTRLRVQGNGYNLIHITPDKAEITLMSWNGKHFAEQQKHTLYR